MAEYMNEPRLETVAFGVYSKKEMVEFFWKYKTEICACIEINNEMWCKQSLLFYSTREVDDWKTWDGLEIRSNRKEELFRAWKFW